MHIFSFATHEKYGLQNMLAFEESLINQLKCAARVFHFLLVCFL